MTGMKNILRALGTTTAAGLIVLLVAVPALAHPKVVSRSPEDGSTVDQPPSEVSVEFDEVVTNANLEVVDPCGSRVDDGDTQTLGYEASVGMSGDNAGTYSVRWEVISEDGHNVSGTWTFSSSGGDACPGSGGSSGGGNGSGSGGGGGSGSGGGGGSGGSTTGGGTASGGSGNGPTVASGGDSGNDAHKGKHAGHDGMGKGKDKKKKSKHNHHSADEPKEVELAAGGDEKSSDMPVDWLLISFAIAGLIGAAGGSIYASIMGPR